MCRWRNEDVVFGRECSTFEDIMSIVLYIYTYALPVSVPQRAGNQTKRDVPLFRVACLVMITDGPPSFQMCDALILHTRCCYASDIITLQF